MSQTDPLAATLAAMRNRITGVFPVQVREAIGKLTDEQLWWRPNEDSNSVGNLVLHLTGSLNHFLNRNLGGIAYDRNREQEFAERRTIPRAELLAMFDEMVANGAKTLDGITVERLGDPSPEQKMYDLVVEDLVSIVAHFATHTGQILWIAKMLSGGGLDDVWMRAHRDEGGWKKRK